MGTGVCGQGGGVYIGTHKVVSLEEWAGTPKGGTVNDIPEFDTTAMVRLACGQATMDGSFKGRWDSTDTAGQKALMAACLGRTSVSLVLKVTATETYTFTAFIETAPIKVPSQGIVEATFNYKSSGTITHAYA